MTIEHEILEQLLAEDWQLTRVITFLDDSGGDAWKIVAGHTQEGNLSFLDSDGFPLPDWKVQEVLRSKDSTVKITAHCTDKGAGI